MSRAGKAVGVFLGGVVGATAWAAPPMLSGPAGSPSQAMPGPQMQYAPMGPVMGAMPAGPARVGLADVIDPQYREAVLAVVRKPTISTRGMSDEVVCNPAVYEWLLEHPDRVSLAWNRLKVPCVPISDLGNGRFAWVDGEGSEVVWQAVGRFQDGVIWYASGKVKPSPVAPVIPVRVVVIVTHPKRPAANGAVTVNPVVQGYLQTDSRAASTMVRVLGPTGSKLAEQAAEQLLFFFNGVARYLYAHPDKTEELLAPAKK